MMERLRNLPTWLRLFLTSLPVLMCLPLACILVFAYQQSTGFQNATATAAAVQTSAAQAATQQAVEAAQQRTAAAQTAREAQTEAAAQQVTAEANTVATATAKALALEQQAQTTTALAQSVITDTPSLAVPTETATRQPVFATATPKTITVTLRECRGDEGVLFFGTAQPQSLHAFSTISFTVPPGTYRLRIDWKGKPENNVNKDLKLEGSQTLTFGDQCR